MRKKNSSLNDTDETSHKDSTLEWWCFEAFFKTEEDKKEWSLKLDFTEWDNSTYKKGSLMIFTLFDIKNDIIYDISDRDDKNKLISSSQYFKIGFKNSYITGGFPKYKIVVEDKKNDINIEMNFDSQSIPHLVAEDISNGWLPLGFGFYKYSFIPRGKIKGIFQIDDKKYTFDGTAYYEHVWGSFTYRKLFDSLKSIKKSISLYGKLLKKEIEVLHPKIPASIKLLSENNPLGYDWTWFLSDNGWTIFYGNMLFWLMQGKAAGLLILTKDGKSYEEFYDLDFKYKTIEKSKHLDYYYPSKFEIIAKGHDSKIVLSCEMQTKSREFISRFNDKKYWKGLVICEAPGIFKGYYYKNGQKISLNGVCKIEPQRQISFFGHNKLEIDFLKTPNKLWIKISFDSHFFNKRLFFKLQLYPLLKLKFFVKE